MVTQTAAEGADDLPYPVVRQPSLRELSKVIRWSDIFWHNNLSLRTLWPALLISKPIVITHQGSYCRTPRGIDLVQRLKHLIVRHTTSVASSKAVAACFATNSTLIYNPYDARKFSADTSGEERTGDLVFLGRLVSEKGVDLLLEALAILRSRDLFPGLTIVGGGPELSSLQQLATRLGLDEQVTFSGPKRDEALARSSAPAQNPRRSLPLRRTFRGRRPGRNRLRLCRGRLPGRRTPRGDRSLRPDFPKRRRDRAGRGAGIAPEVA